MNFPALGVSVLAGAVAARGLSVRTVYGSILLAARMGLERYDAACKTPTHEMMGERLFLPHAYAPEQLATLGAGVPMSPGVQRLFDGTRPLIPRFVETVGRQVLATRPGIVGIATNFQQTMAALAIARFVKQRAPSICVVLGGANVAQPMGEALAGVFPWIDHVFAGESDTSFPDFCEALVREGRRSPTRVVYAPPISDMRAVSAPDFSDYFAALRHHQRRGRLPASLPDFLTMETSRGCWWGQKHHCTFCGLNGDGMGFRIKPTASVLAEIGDLTQRWGVRRIHFSDNIMPRDFAAAGVRPPAGAARPISPRAEPQPAATA